MCPVRFVTYVSAGHHDSQSCFTRSPCIAPLNLPAGTFAPGDALTIGVRPEHLTIGGAGAFAASGVVELVERLGESSFAHVRRADDKLMVAEVCGRDAPAPGASVTLGAPAADVHAFDAAGRRLEAADFATA